MKEVDSHILNRYNRAKLDAKQRNYIFAEHQRLAENRPKTNVPKYMPPITDGTASGIIKRLPKRVLQQVPTGKTVAYDTDPAMDLTTDFLLNNVLLRHAAGETGMLQMLWQTLEAGATYGFSTWTYEFAQRNDDYAMKAKRHYWADVFPGAGVKDMNHGDVFVREWWNKKDIKKLLKKLNALENSGWDKAGLKSMLDSDSETSKDTYETSLTDQDAGIQETGYEIIKLYGGNKITTFTSSGTLLREQKLPPRTRGIRTFYYDSSGEDVYGRSLVRLIGGMQNFIDYSLQAKAYATMVESDPMIIAKGIATKDVAIKPHTVLPVGDSASIEPFKYSTPSLVNFGQDHALNQSYIFNLVNNGATNISASAGTQTMGKTPRALAMQNAQMDVDDNFVRKNLEFFLSKVYSEMLNLYFDAMPEQFLVELDQEYAQRLRAINPMLVNENNEVIVDNQDYANFEYEVDIESSRVQDRAQQLDGYLQLLDSLKNNPVLSQRFEESGAYDRVLKGIIRASGAPDAEDIIAGLEAEGMRNIITGMRINQVPQMQLTGGQI